MALAVPMPALAEIPIRNGLLPFQSKQLVQGRGLVPKILPSHAPIDTGRFPMPKALLPAVNFWDDVFTHYRTDEAVIHDREHPQVVWAVISLPYAASGRVDPVGADRAMTQAIKTIRQRLTTSQAYLQRHRRAALDPTADPLLRAAARLPRHALKDAAKRVRAQRGMAEHFQTGLKRSKSWLTELQTILQDENVPKELIALPFVETMFTPRARSAAGAAGLWQLMPTTARHLGLKVSRRRDDRLDIRKATKAAGKMLRNNFRRLGNWPLAITAYNHGPNGIRRAVAQVGSSDLVELIRRYRKRTWGFASKNFYAEFLAALRALALDEDVGQYVAYKPASDSNS